LGENAKDSSDFKKNPIWQECTIKALEKELKMSTMQRKWRAKDSKPFQNDENRGRNCHGKKQKRSGSTEHPAE
jgi:hypothetical protein